MIQNLFMNANVSAMTDRPSVASIIFTLSITIRWAKRATIVRSLRRTVTGTTASLLMELNEVLSPSIARYQALPFKLVCFCFFFRTVSIFSLIGLSRRLCYCWRQESFTGRRKRYPLARNAHGRLRKILIFSSKLLPWKLFLKTTLFKRVMVVHLNVWKPMLCFGKRIKGE